MNVYLEVYGCSANQSDAEIISGLLEKEGFKLVKTSEKSDINIICTCTVKVPTSQRMMYRIKELSRYNKPLIVAGCMPAVERSIIENINSKASLLGPNSIQNVVDVVRKTLEGKKIVCLEDVQKPKLCLPKIRKNSIINILQISKGCVWQKCTYCVVKLARGKLRNYPPELILKEVKKSLKDGCREIWLTSQDNAAYNNNGLRLPDLIHMISKIEGRFFVRVGMMNPLFLRDIENELIKGYKSEKIFKFLHLPVESGSNSVLKDMRRGYTVENFLTTVKKFRKAFPMLTLATDVIVGFPGETERDFERTVGLIENVKPDIVNISKFGIRPGTDAANMEQLPNDTIKRRSKQLSEVVRRIQLEKNEKWLEWSGEILIDEVGRKGGLMGRNFAYKPVVVRDGKLGNFIKVKIIDTKRTYLVGNPLD